MELEKNFNPKGESQEKKGETRNKRMKLGGENKDTIDRRTTAKRKQDSKIKAMWQKKYNHINW